MAVLVVGDLHLGKWPQGVPQDYKPWETLFAQILDILDSNSDIKEIVFLGDIFDGVATLEQLKYFCKKLQELKDVLKLLIYGNHDYISSDYHNFMWFLLFQELGGLSDCKFYTQPTVEKLSIGTCEFLPWPNHKCKKKGSTVFAHFAANGALSDNGMKLKTSVSLKPNHRWIIGDLHKHQKNYPGAPMQFTYGDDDRKYLTIVYKSKIKFIPANVSHRLEQHKVDLDNIKFVYSNLKNRPENVYSKLKLATEIYETPWLKKLNSLERVICEPAGRADIKTDKVVIEDVDSAKIRQTLVQGRLKSLPKIKRKRAQKLVEKIEQNLKGL